MSVATGAGEPFPFDEVAAGYDRDFGGSLIGRRLRERVQERLDHLFAPGDRVLELACGTGADALHLADRGIRVTATDLSERMLEVAANRSAGIPDRPITLCQLDLNRLDRSSDSLLDGPFDGAFSNFGGLNCVGDFPSVGRFLAERLAPRAPLLLTVMGPTVPWEWSWFLARGRPRKAFRRLAPGGIGWRGLEIRYPSIRRLEKALPDFERRRVTALGALTPPTYAEGWAARHPRVLDILDRLERRWGSRFPLPHLADHYVLELVRR